MARLIDADALIPKICHACNMEFSDAPCEPSDCRIRHVVMNAPTVDAVEVVRCKECKHWHHDIGWCDKHSHFVDEKDGACHPWESLNWKMFDADDFCSYGERKAET